MKKKNTTPAAEEKPKSTTTHEDIDQQRLQSILDSAPYGVHFYELKDDGRLVFLGANRTAGEILGIDHSVFLSKTIEEAFPNLVQTHIPSAYRQVALTGTPFEEEQLVYSQDRISGAFEIHAVQTGVKRMAAFFRDVTERKQMEQALQERSAQLEALNRTLEQEIEERKETESRLQSSEERFAKAFQASPDCMSITRLKDSMFLAINDGFTELTGYTPADVHGKTSLEINIWADSNDRTRMVEELENNGRVKNILALFRLKDGEQKAGLMSSTLTEVSGEPCILCIVHDISDLKRAEENLIRERTLLSRVVETSPIGIVFLDPVGNITFANLQSEMIFGLTRNKITQKTYNAPEWKITDFEGKPFPDEQLPFVQVRSTKRSIYDVQHAIEWPDGHRIFLSINAAPVVNENGDVEGVVATIRDITEQKRIEIEVKMLANALKSVNECVSITDAENNILFVNEAFERTYGYALSELLNKNIEMFRAEQHDSLSQTILGATVKKGWDGELFNRRKDGTVFPISLHSSVIYDDRHQPIALIGIASDITEQKKAEEQLRKLSRAVEQSPDAIMISSAQGEVEYVNLRCTELTGYAREEIIGLQTAGFHSEGAIKEAFEEALRTVQAGGEWHGELISRKKSGEYYYEAVHAAPVLDDHGTITHVLTIRADITQRKRMEEQLRRSEERYKQFFDEDITGDFICTVDGRLRDCNYAFTSIFGFASRQEALQSNFSLLYPSTAMYRDFIDILAANRKLEYHEMEMRSITGKELSVVLNAIASYDQQEELVEFRGYIFDETKKQILEEQLRQIQKMESMGTLAGGIAHDFNNILNNVLGFAHQIKKHIHEPEKVLRYGETIEKSANRGAELTNQLLAFSRQKKRENAEVDIEKLIGEILSLLHETFPKSITLESDVASVLLSVKGDHGTLFQMLLNLCVNARDAMPLGGVLRLEARNRIAGEDLGPVNAIPDTKECIELKIIDNGTGIPDAYKRKIFDPFFTTKEKEKGTGLGLSIVFNVVKEHGGTISVESEEGKGSAFSIILPAFEASAAAVVPDILAIPVSKKNELILLVDDEEPMRQLGEDLLEEYGYRVVTASDGLEALEWYKLHHTEVALVILDLIMPRMDGGQTFIEMKRLNTKVKALFCSGYTSDKVITQLLEQENLRAIQKPFHPDDFIRVVQAVLAEE